MNVVFNISSEEEFINACLETFRYQYKHVEVYKKFVDYLKIDVSKVNKLSDIPFLPIEMFKNHKILDSNFKSEFYFQSSGTTNIQTQSKHYIANFQLYEDSIYDSFKRFIGSPEDYIFLGLLPSYLERENSSLVYMVNFLMSKSDKPENGYFLYNHAELYDLIDKVKDKKVILFGVSFALLDFLDYCCEVNKTEKLSVGRDFIIIETGGMKGRKEEMTKENLLDILQKGFGTSKIYSEYSMTELLSQAYSLGQNIYKTPSWMRILIRNTEDPFSYMDDGKTGAINIIDLANRYSCSFIATQDLGKKVFSENHQFEVLGRMDNSDVRGCSLLVS